VKRSITLEVETDDAGELVSLRVFRLDFCGPC